MADHGITDAQARAHFAAWADCATSAVSSKRLRDAKALRNGSGAGL